MSEKLYGGLTRAQLRTIRATAIARRRGIDQLHGHGLYLTVRRDISRTVEHLDKLGQRHIGMPFQAVPFAHAEDTNALSSAYNALASAYNALPDLLAEIELLQAQSAAIEEKALDAHQRAFGEQNYEYVDHSTTLDLLVAEITALRHEKSTLAGRLAAIEEQSAEEEREALARYVPIQHGVTCKKEEHIRSGYLHSAEDDSPYDVDGMMYCGRCHVAI